MTAENQIHSFWIDCASSKQYFGVTLTMFQLDCVNQCVHKNYIFGRMKIHLKQHLDHVMTKLRTHIQCKTCLYGI